MLEKMLGIDKLIAAVKGEEVVKKVGVADSFKNTYQQIANAQAQLKDLTKDSFSADNIEQYRAALSGLTDEQAEAVLKSKQLTKAQIDKIVVTKTEIGVTKEDAATELLEAEATEKQTAENRENTQSIREKAAATMQGAKSALKSMSTFSKIGIVVGIITAVVGVIEKFATSTEGLKEKTDELMDSYQSAFDEANRNAERVEELADKYQELSAGVDDLGNNISLTTDEYKEYNSLVNEIADMFPTLIQGYTDEGTAILNLTGNINQLRDAYKEAQIEAYNLLIASGEDANGKDIIEYWNRYQNGGNGWEQFKADIATMFFGNREAQVGVTYSYQTALNELKDFTEMSWEEYEAAQGTAAISSKLYDLFDVMGVIHPNDEASFGAAKQSAQALMQTYQAMIDNALSGMKSLANAYLNVDPDYQSLDSETQKIASIIVNSLDEKREFQNQTDVAVYVQEVLDMLQDNPSLKSGLMTLFNTDFSDMDITEAKDYIDEYLDELSTLLGMEKNQLIINLGFQPYYDTADAYDSMLSKGANAAASTLEKDTTKVTYNPSKGGLIIGESDEEFEARKEAKRQEISNKIDEFAKEYSINTQDEIAAFNDALSISMGNIDRAFKYYLEQMEQKLAESKLSKVDMLSQVESLSEGFDILNNIYTDVLDGGEFDYSSILNNDEFKEAFKGYDEEYNNFIETVANSPNDIGACQSAFNDLATAYIYDKAALEDVTEETKQATIAMLQQMGVANAEEVVMKQLAINTATLADAQANLNELKEAGVDTSVDLENATAEEILLLIQEAENLKLDTTELHNYLTQKLRANQIKMTTDGDIQSLANLCKSLGIASDVITKYNALKKAAFTKDNVETSNLHDKNTGKILMLKDAGEEVSEADLIKEMQDAILDFVNGEYQVDLDVDGGKEAEKVKETFDWIETKISRLQRLITNLGKTISATWKSFGTRKNALSEQTDRIREEIQTQTNARDAYKKKADSVDLSEADKKLVREGAIKIDEITDETRKEKIQEYQEWYDKYLSADDAIADAEEELAGSLQEEFDLIAGEYEGKLSEIEHEINEIDAAIEAAENRGLIVGSSFYDSLQQKEIEKRNLLKNQLKDMEAKLENPEEYGIVENSEEWYNLKSQIWETEEAIREAENAIIDYGNSARQADWDIFDKQQEKISQLYSETEFLMDLLDNDDLFDKDNGSMTERGEAAFGLHAINYQAYLEQAEDYAEELAEIEKEIAEEGESTDLLERRQELIEAQRESILNAEAEKEAIHGLYEEYYNNLLDVLQEIIDKRKEELQVTKDLYDYERNISEKTKTVSSYQKQLEAFSGDDSEETQSKIQQIKLQLEQAEQDLQDTEYERYLSDQEQMLDSLVDDTQEWVNERLDNIDGLLKEAIEKTESGATKISDTLKEIAGGFGINLSDELDAVLGTENVDTEQEKQVPVMKNVVTVLEGIKTLVEQLVIDDPSGTINLPGYAKGSRRIPRNEFAWTQENGTELIYRSSDGAMLTPLGQGDAVFTSAMTQRLWDIAQNPNIFGGLTTTAMPMGLVNNGATNDIRNDVEFNITMYGVNNPAEFAKQLQFAIKTDKPVQKTIQDVTIGAAMGRNSLTRFTR